ncbi:MAG TPA: Panacea domain-containing protein [Thermoanaerobaculia bacterium]
MITKKFTELVLHVARETEHDRKCGKTKLNKILFFSDFEAYRVLGSSITGQDYLKFDKGPVCRGMLPLIARLEENGDAEWEPRNYYGLTLLKLKPHRAPDLSVFSEAELEIVARVIEDLEPLDATDVSQLSHLFAGWQVVANGEKIPYNSVFVGAERELSEDELAWADEVIREYESGDNPKLSPEDSHVRPSASSGGNLDGAV